MKVCPKCDCRLEAASFHKDKTRNGGRHPYCRQCTSQARKKRDASHKAENNCRVARWQKLNPDRVKQAAAKYRKRHPLTRRSRDRQWNESNPDKRKAKNNRYNLRHREQRRIANRNLRAHYIAAGLRSDGKPRKAKLSPKEITSPADQVCVPARPVIEIGYSSPLLLA